MSTIGIGIVGCGGNGRNHTEVWNTINNAKVVGVCDIIPEKAKELANMLGVKAFTSIHDLVKDPDVDAVDIVTDTASHRDPTVVAAESGKHVMVEVGFSRTIAEADDMIAAADKSGVNLMYAQTQRFYPNHIKAKELIDSGEIGDPISMQYTFHREARPDREFPPNELWHRWRSKGGGFFLYEGPHFTDQIKYLMGSEIETVYTIGMGRFVSGGDGEDNGLAGFKMSNGTFSTLWRGVSYPGASNSSWRLVGTKGMLDVVYPIEPGTGRISLGKNGEWKDIPFPHQNEGLIRTPNRNREPINFYGFQTEFQEFIDSITENRQPSCDGNDGKASIMVVLAVLESHETGNPVNIPAMTLP